jgi:hypothetical protein
MIPLSFQIASPSIVPRIAMARARWDAEVRALAVASVQVEKAVRRRLPLEVEAIASPPLMEIQWVTVTTLAIPVLLLLHF